MREGDRNTALFHAKATKRSKINHVDGLIDSDRASCQTNEGMEKVVVEYFQGL